MMSAESADANLADADESLLAALLDELTDALAARSAAGPGAAGQSAPEVDGRSPFAVGDRLGCRGDGQEWIR